MITPIQKLVTYQDESTIYFCSVGSRPEISEQAAEDWFQSDLAIFIGARIGTLSDRFEYERRLLDELRPLCINWLKNFFSPKANFGSKIFERTTLYQ